MLVLWLKQRLKSTALITAGLLICSLATADSFEFIIENGDVTVTPARCPPDTCSSQSGVFRGSFVADISGDVITFAKVQIKSSVAGFSLPANPNEDSGGTSRQAKFQFDGQRLTVKGVIDSRAFDGPLYEYSLVAVSDGQSAAFDPQGFYSARQDFRRCASPMCGGIYVTEVNHRYLRCPDGKWAKECYVGNVDWQSLGGNVFDGDETLLLKGEITVGDDPITSWGTFVVDDAYRGAVDSPAKGFFVGVQSNGIVCITSPCFSYDQYFLNRRWQTTLSGIRLERTGADKQQIEQAYNILGNGEALLGVGYNRYVKELHGRGKVFVATQFYLPVKADVSVRLCPTGYTETDMGCATRHGCFYPDIEVISVGGAAFEDPDTGELIASQTYSCASSCELPGELISEGYCSLALP